MLDMKTLLGGLALTALVALIGVMIWTGVVGELVGFSVIAVIVGVSLYFDMRRQARDKQEREARMDALRRQRQNTPD